MNLPVENSSIDLPDTSLQVPGLAENRPSVLRGDHLFVKIKAESDYVEYKGYVHSVEREVVHLGFGQKYVFITGAGKSKIYE